MATAISIEPEMLQTMPSDAARHVQWGFAERYDLQLLVQSARAVARGGAARTSGPKPKRSCWRPSMLRALRPPSWMRNMAAYFPDQRILRSRSSRLSWRG